MSRLRAWLELARLSNLPTVWSNTLTGLGVGYIASVLSHGPSTPAPTEPQLLAAMLAGGGPVLLAASFFYIAGMILNDVLDRDIDSEERPGRPIPSGRVGVGAARSAAFVMLLVGTVLIGLYGARPWSWAMALVGLIVLYNLLHAQWRGAVVFMGACRSVLVLMAASIYPAADAVWWGLIAPLALLLGLYVVLLSLVARGEASGKAEQRAAWPRGVALAMIPLVLAGAVVARPVGLDWLAVGVTAAALAAWLGWAARHLRRTPADVRAAVHAHLAGICLIDAYFLSLLGLPLFAVVAGVCFGLTVWAHRRVAGT